MFSQLPLSDRTFGIRVPNPADLIRHQLEVGSTIPLLARSVCVSKSISGVLCWCGPTNVSCVPAGLDATAVCSMCLLERLRSFSQFTNEGVYSTHTHLWNTDYWITPHAVSVQPDPTLFLRLHIVIKEVLPSLSRWEVPTQGNSQICALSPSSVVSTAHLSNAR